MARVLTIGGVFFKCKDPEALGEWYAKWLGLSVDPGYGAASFVPENLPPGTRAVWGPFAADTDYFAPSEKEFMINLVVDDLDGALEQVAEGGAEIVGEVEEYEYGRFGSFLDPEGNKVELWQPDGE